MEEKIIENRKRYQDRISLFKEFGYDVAKERDFIIEKSQPIEGKILELGTGKGYFTVSLAQQGHHFTTVDISEEEQKFARMNIQYLGLDSKVEFVIDNAEQLKVDDENFDIAFAINLIHHLDHPFNVIDELIRVVSQKGKIILSDFSKKGFEVISRIHKSEGRHHSDGKCGLKDIENYLLKKNYQIENHNTDLQELMIVYKGSDKSI